MIELISKKIVSGNLKLRLFFRYLPVTQNLRVYNKNKIWPSTCSYVGPKYLQLCRATPLKIPFHKQCMTTWNEMSNKNDLCIFRMILMIFEGDNG
jgi:hypothetical protein